MSPDGARDEVARRKLGAGYIRHEAIAILVDKCGSFAAHGLADEF
jgi:hypothetical protein